MSFFALNQWDVDRATQFFVACEPALSGYQVCFLSESSVHVDACTVCH
jgi:hypothetical protein